jgi:2'-5' RNA ligase
MRLFVGVRPPEPVLDRVAELVESLRRASGAVGAAGAAEAVRWTSREQWHVTLRFFGEVDDPAPVVEALEQAELMPAGASLGPAVRMLGRQVVCAPVSGLDALATAVVGASAHLGQPPDPRPFRGHVTLARVRRRGGGGGRTGRSALRTALAGVIGAEIAASWPVEEVALVRSRLDSDRPRYEDLHVRRLS